MIIIGIGSNLPSPCYASPQETGAAALVELEQRGVTIVARSQWYDTAPVPVSDQPWYANAVVAVVTDAGPHDLLSVLQDIESAFGRTRSAPNAARTLDLDLIAYDEQVIVDGERLVVPHRRMHERAFVLLPLAEIAPDWRHPVTGLSVAGMIAAMPPGQRCHLSGKQKK